MQATLRNVSSVEGLVEALLKAAAAGVRLNAGCDEHASEVVAAYLCFKKLLPVNIYVADVLARNVNEKYTAGPPAQFVVPVKTNTRLYLKETSGEIDDVLSVTHVDTADGKNRLYAPCVLTNDLPGARLALEKYRLVAHLLPDDAEWDRQRKCIVAGGVVIDAVAAVKARSRRTPRAPPADDLVAAYFANDPAVQTFSDEQVENLTQLLAYHKIFLEDYPKSGVFVSWLRGNPVTAKDALKLLGLKYGPRVKYTQNFAKVAKYAPAELLSRVFDAVAPLNIYGDVLNKNFALTPDKRKRQTLAERDVKIAKTDSNEVFEDALLNN